MDFRVWPESATKQVFSNFLTSTTGIEKGKMRIFSIAVHNIPAKSQVPTYDIQQKQVENRIPCPDVWNKYGILVYGCGYFRLSRELRLTQTNTPRCYLCSVLVFKSTCSSSWYFLSFIRSIKRDDEIWLVLLRPVCMYSLSIQGTKRLRLGIQILLTVLILLEL